MFHTLEDRYSDKISDKMFKASYYLLESQHRLTGGTIKVLVEEDLPIGITIVVPLIYSDKCSCPVSNKCSKFFDLITYNN